MSTFLKFQQVIVFISLFIPLNTTAQRTPTMGWSSWNTFALNINEELIFSQAMAMHQNGLQKAGYRYVNIDDGYWDGRGEDGHLRLNNKLFPNGMRKLVDDIHKLGLKAGIYSDAGDNSCGCGTRAEWGHNVGFAGHEQQDCRLYFDEWDFDFIKVDYCGGMHMRLDEKEQYSKISEAIRSCQKKNIVFNICRWAYPGTWAEQQADSWRTTGDIYDNWKSVKAILAENLYLSAYCRNGHYNDMDMLEVGRSMNQTEDETHFAMWCIMSSPLLIGCDMTNIRPQSLKLLCNKDLIALNQDPLHLQAYIAEKQGECYILVKDIKKKYSNKRAFAIYNPTDEMQYVRLDMLKLDLKGEVQLYDCISQRPCGIVNRPVTLAVPPHGTKVFTTKGGHRIDRTRYEAETAWMNCYQELHGNDNPPSANYQTKANASGGHVAGFLGKRAENDIVWDNVNVKKKGMRTLTFNCFCGEERSFSVEVNGKCVGILHAKGSDWNSPISLSINAFLEKGGNTIRLYNTSEWMPDIDFMQID